MQKLTLLDIYCFAFDPSFSILFSFDAKSGLWALGSLQEANPGRPFRFLDVALLSWAESHLWARALIHLKRRHCYKISECANRRFRSEQWNISKSRSSPCKTIRQDTTRDARYSYAGWLQEGRGRQVPRGEIAGCGCTKCLALRLGEVEGRLAKGSAKIMSMTPHAL